MKAVSVHCLKESYSVSDYYSNFKSNDVVSHASVGFELVHDAFRVVVQCMPCVQTISSGLRSEGSFCLVGEGVRGPRPF